MRIRGGKRAVQQQEDSGPAAFRRASERSGRVPTRTRLFQGVGALPDVFKNFAINTFLLLYYNQVLGLPAFYVSVALFAALLVDAITDPVVGSYSDSFRSRLGRRHPFMYAAALPLGICIYFLFSPPAVPDSLPREALLLAWLGFFVIATRVCMTFFLIPWNALFAEFSDDYQERSIIVSYRFFFAWVGGITFSFSMYSLVFPGSPEYPLGQLNPASYQTFAAVLAICVVTAVLVTTHFTRDQVPYLMQPQGAIRPFNLRRVLTDVRMALGNRDFLILFSAVLASSVVIGTNGAFEIYMRTYFWELDTASLRWLALGFTGALLAFATIGRLQNRFDKKHLLVGCSVLLMIQGMLLVGLRFLDVLPPNGDPLLLNLLIADAIVRAYLATTALIMFVSMVADTLDVQELNTGQRQEGVFNSAIAFSSKATTGIGMLIAGALLDAVIRFPPGGPGVAVGADVVVRLGIIDGFAVPLFTVVWMVLALRYSITRDRHEEVRRRLTVRRGIGNGAVGNRAVL
jgi:glycoside/pentoside/hexuronide:cation symporter, GPH family